MIAQVLHYNTAAVLVMHMFKLLTETGVSNLVSLQNISTRLEKKLGGNIAQVLKLLFNNF